MPVYLSELYKVRRRYQRSIQVAQDWKNGNGLDGYLLTPTAQQVAEQILLGIESSDYPTAWTITGPFGTGKSAFALFLTDLLGNEEPKHSDAKRLRLDLQITQTPLIPILIQGQRSPLDVDFVNALGRSFKNISPSFYKEIVEFQKTNRDHRTIVQLFEKATSEAQRLNCSGILVVVDEFGKYLEYAADNPEEVDLLLMQDLAEASARSDNPFIFITILHSAFADYLSNVDNASKAEWQKVQGRFADISFIEPGEQFLKLIGAAIQADHQNKTVSSAQKKVRQILASQAFDEVRKRIPLEDLLANCAPLHPSTALLLWPLFRSALSQNERSLFSFLNDYSPYGFQDYLARTEAGGSFYHISELYDYITFTIGDSVLLSLQARRWAEIANAINRIEVDAPQLATHIIKVIGLISLFGDQVGLKATPELFKSIYDDIEAIDEAIRYLEKISTIVFRKFDGAYSIWEGSDVDLDAAYAHAQNRVHHGYFAQRLENMVQLQPIVARAHYIQTGTMRYFNVAIIDGDVSKLEIEQNQDVQPADGKVFFVLSENNSERNALINKAIELTSNLGAKDRLKVFAFPKPMKGLDDALSNLERWNWVKENTPELAGDRVARQEVRAQIRNATKKLLDIAGETLGLHGYLFTPSASVWIHAGTMFEHKSSIEFQKWLSSLCAETFHEAPNLFNELINRENVSSAAAAIRRNLIQKMIEGDGKENLEFIGTPPEYSMYRSLLEEGGFYRKRNSGFYSFDGLPAKAWRPVWYAMRNYLDSTTSGRLPLRDLWEILKSPPLGLREGPIPILICVLLLAYKERVALFEDGRFVPEIRIEILELLIKAPETFEIQLYELEGETKEAFEAVGEVLEQLDLAILGNQGNGNLLDVIKPLVVFAARLPDYTKKTKSLNPLYVVDVRDALIKARDPYTLLFQTLPEILKVSIDSPKNARTFADRLKTSLFALKQAYPSLLDRIESSFREAFEENDIITSIDLRDAIIQRAAPLLGYTSDPTLKLFIQDTGRISNRDWREVLARAINQGLPTDKWLDHSVVDFQLRLMQIASDFKRLESLVREKERVDDSKIILRVSVLDGVEKDRSKIIAITTKNEESTSQLTEKIERELESSNENSEIKLAAIGKILEKLLNLNGGE
jgi:hypothetical protein